LMRSSAATIQRNMLSIPRMPDGSPRYARGWHMVGWSSEFEAGKAVARDYFGQRLAFFRGEDGKVRCVEAFCPHLGADLSAGTVVGNSLRCAFHSWRFDGEGQCIEIPYCDKIPPRAKTRAFPTHEINDTVMVWYDPEHGEPEYDIPALKEYLPKSAPGSNGWTKGWHHFKFTLKTHPREVIENVVDKGHLLPIHGFDVDHWLPIWNGHMCGELTWGTHISLAKDVPGDKLFVRNVTYGPSYQYTWQVQTSKQFDSLILTAWCPVDENTLDYWFGVIVRANDSEFTPEMIEQAAERYCQDSHDSFNDDVFIWERKLYRPEPVLCAGDGPIAQIRRWYTQFYTDRAQVNNANYYNNNHEWTVEELRDEMDKVLAAQKKSAA
jgi:3-ketosteroid 9alpha-monooxygenase subunit A